MATIAIPGVSLSVEALERNWPRWEQISRDWQKMDRMEMTEKQAISIAEKVMDSDYFSSQTLRNPSIEEFMLITREDGMEENTYVAFRKSLLTEDDILEDEMDGVKRKFEPFIDAYVYANNGGTVCNFVLTLCTCVMEHEGKHLYSTGQFITYKRFDFETTKMIAGDQEYFFDFARSIKAIYLAIQMLSLERPEVVMRESVRVEHTETVKKKGKYKKVRKTNMVKLIRISPDDMERFINAVHRTITCPNWDVAGHWRHYKSGKRVWIKPYRKGKQRNNPAAYQPKEYQLPKEDKA